MLINSYDFSTDVGVQNIMHFIMDLNTYIYVKNEILTVDIKQNFDNMVNNLYKLQQYLGIDEKWSLPYPPVEEKLDIMSVQNTKIALQKILIKSVLHKTRRNIIFEFHRFQPFTIVMERTYKLLINALLDIKPHFGIEQPVILSLYLTHAAVYNNTSAIRILLEEYRVSPIITWPDLPRKYIYSGLHIMPILLIANVADFTDHLKFFDVSWQDQQYNFILMLHKINFSNDNITLLQIQQIFKSALNNKFFDALDYLLEQVEFCNRIEFSQEKARLLEENARLQEQISLLEQTIYKLQIDLKHCQQQNEMLLTKQELILNKFNYKRCYNCFTLFSPPQSPCPSIPSTPILGTPTLSTFSFSTSPGTPATIPERLDTYLRLQYASKI